jgi:hypothetical protein
MSYQCGFDLSNNFLNVVSTSSNCPGIKIKGLLEYAYLNILLTLQMFIRVLQALVF